MIFLKFVNGLNFGKSFLKIKMKCFSVKDKLTPTLPCHFQNFRPSHLRSYQLVVCGLTGLI